MKNPVYLHIVIPPGQNGSPKLESKFQELLISLRNTVVGQRFSFEFFGYQQHTYFYIVADQKFQGTIEGLIYSMYPDAEIRVTKDYTTAHNPDYHHFAVTQLKLLKRDVYPIRTFDDFEEDSMSRFFSTISKLEQGEQIWTQMVVEPRDDTGVYHIRRRVKYWLSNFRHFFSVRDRLRKGGKKGIHSTRNEYARYKEADKPFKVTVRCAYLARDPAIASRKLKAVVDSFGQFTDTDINGLVPGRVSSWPAALEQYKRRDHGKPFIFSSKEVATLFHLPNPDYVSHVVHVLARKSDPPEDLPRAGEPGVSAFGVTNYHNNFVPFGIHESDRRRHLYVVGKSGSGKSKLLELLINTDIKNGKGVAVLDPHGDLVDNVLAMIPEERIEDVILFDPADTEFPIAFNPLMAVDPKYKMQLTIGILDIFKKLFGSNWSDRLEHVLRYTILALLDSPNTTVLSILKMLTDKNYRQKIVARIQDNVVKSFWVSEFAAWSEKFDADAITPLLNKVGQFVATDMIRNIVGQPDTKFDIREVMDGQKILLMKVSKGLLGEENASLIGSMIITKMYQAAMSRADIAEKDRPDFYFYVDEFQNFATDTFYEILSEARKYHLDLTIAHQYMGQLSEKIRQTVFGNVGSMISFRVGAEDARILAEEYEPIFKERDIINLGVREFYTKMSVKGEIREAFSGRTLDVPQPMNDVTARIKDHSRKMYCLPQKDVEELLRKWDEAAAEPDDDASMQIEEKFEAPIV